MGPLADLLGHLVEAGGTDLVVKAGTPPRIRLDGELVPAPFEALDPSGVAALLEGIVPAALSAELASHGEVDFAHGVAGVGRFRVSAFRQRGSLAVVFHRVAPGLPPADQLGMPPVLDRLCEPGRGLVVLTGPAGSGVSTTLAALVDHVNGSRACHVVTVEHPVEYLHVDRLAMVSQREVGTDTPSFAAAVTRAGRQGADVVAVGDVPDAETVRAILAAAELGALVVAAVPALSVTEALVRMVEAFPETERRRAGVALGSVVRAVLSQRLLERADGRGRVAAYEVLLGTPKVRDCIAEHRLGDVARLIADGEYRGMQTLDRALELLVRDGLVSVNEAVASADDPDGLRLVLGSLTARG